MLVRLLGRVWTSNSGLRVFGLFIIIYLFLRIINFIGSFVDCELSIFFLYEGLNIC